MGEQTQVHEHARERQLAEPLKPCEKQQAAALALGEILDEPAVVERHEQAIRDDDRAKERGDAHRSQHKQQRRQHRAHRERHRKVAHERLVVFERVEVVHLHPHDHEDGDKPHAQRAIEHGDTREVQEHGPQHAPQGQHHQQAPVEAGHDPLEFALVDHVRHIPGVHHVEDARHGEGHEQAVRDHRVEQLGVVTSHARKAGGRAHAQQQQDAQDHGAGADEAGVAICLAQAEQALARKELFEAEAYACHEETTSW